MINDVERILLTEEQIHQKVSEIGKRIYGGSDADG